MYVFFLYIFKNVIYYCDGKADGFLGAIIAINIFVESVIPRIIWWIERSFILKYKSFVTI